MTQIIDRRKNIKGKSSENRQKFLKRIKNSIKDQLPDIISKRKIKNLGNSGEKIKISRNKGISEPVFRHGEGGRKDYVIPGNRDFVPGDTIPKDGGGDGDGRGRQGSDEGSWEDEFVIELSQKEFLDYLFEDLELPNLVDKQLKSVQNLKFKNAGFSKDGSPNKLSIIRSFKQSLSRRIASSSIIKKRINEYQIKLNSYNEETNKLLNQDDLSDEEIKNLINKRKQELNSMAWFQDFQRCYLKLNNIPFFDSLDLRYKIKASFPTPITHATMIMIMDNSGSMGEKEKTIARKFFYLLYSFLNLHYEKIDLVFISHTTDAKIMDEREFFNTRESGGTVVSSALELASTVISDIGNKSNIYISQISDGDNFPSDNKVCEEIILNNIISFVQYFAYIQIDDYHQEEDHNNNTQISLSQILGTDKGLWNVYDKLSQSFSKFKIKRVYEEKDIYSVFQQLFEKKL